MDIDIKELIKTAAEGFDLSNFKGDVVGVKIVENEIGNVENGGIGVQKVYPRSFELSSDENLQEEAAAAKAAKETPPEKHNGQPEESLNLCAPKINLQRLLREAWFAEARTDGKYDGRWTDVFIEALMASEYGEGIARQWAVSGARNKRDQIKGYVVGLLKDAGVLKGSYDGIARLADPSDKKRRLSHYMSEGKQQLYAEWVKGYVEREQED